MWNHHPDKVKPSKTSPYALSKFIDQVAVIDWHAASWGKKKKHRPLCEVQVPVEFLIYHMHILHMYIYIYTVPPRHAGWFKVSWFLRYTMIHPQCRLSLRSPTNHWPPFLPLLPPDSLAAVGRQTQREVTSHSDLAKDLKMLLIRVKKTLRKWHT